MVGGLIGGLLLAFILTIFDFDSIVIHGVKELFNRDITDSTYYLIFAVVGLIFGLFNR